MKTQSSKTADPRAAALARLGGSEDALQELVAVFHHDCAPLLNDMQSAIRDGNPRRLRFAAHTLKGMVAFFSADRAAAAALERMADNGDLSQAATTFQVLTHEVEELTQRLDHLDEMPVANLN